MNRAVPLPSSFKSATPIWPVTPEVAGSSPVAPVSQLSLHTAPVWVPNLRVVSDNRREGALKSAALSLVKPAKRRPPLSCFDASERVADLPEGGCPEADEKGASFGVAAFILVDGLSADPEADAQADGSEREDVELRAAKTTAVQRIDDHPRASARSCRVQSRARRGIGKRRVESPLSRTTAVDRCAVAGGDRVDVLELHVADDTDASQRRER